MAEIGKDEFKNKVEAWFDKHGKPWDKSVPISITLGSNKQRFIIFEKFVESSGGKYRNALGYYVDANDDLQCRHFYQSNSESFWRAGTGFRDDYAWVKGAEGHTDDMRGGYIFEGQLHHDFHLYLDNMKDTFTFKQKEVCSLSQAIKYISNIKLKHYLVRPESNNAHGIISEYATKRKKVEVLKGVNLACLPNDKLKATQVDFQRSVQSKQKGVSSALNPNDHAAILAKKEGSLWDHIKKNLDLSNAVATYEFRHALLDEMCEVRCYTLINAVPDLKSTVEIAFTKKMLPMQYKSVSGVVQTITTPVCWVKSAYVGSDVSSFGNYKTYPEDLCFLVQKPMDYLDQCRPSNTPEGYTQDKLENIKRMGIEGKVKEVTVDKEKKNIFLVTQDALGNKAEKYMKLAFYNEKYSPLIIEFKKKQKFPLFKSGSEKYMKMTETDIKKALADLKDPNNLDMIKKNLEASCIEYHIKNMVEYSKGNKSKGVKRAKDFVEFVHDLTSYDEINNAIYNLFIKNEVGKQTYWFAPIRTTDSSLFTIFSHYIRLALFDFYPFEVAYQTPAKSVIERSYSEIKTGKNNAFARFILKMIALGCISCGEGDHMTPPISQPNRETLLDALGGKS